MKALTPTLTDAQRAALSELFDQKGPVLVEVRFPRMATSPDWFLCDTPADFDPLWERLGPGAEVHLHSVWDLKDTGRAVVIER